MQAAAAQADAKQAASLLKCSALEVDLANCTQECAVLSAELAVSKEQCCLLLSKLSSSAGPATIPSAQSQVVSSPQCLPSPQHLLLLAQSQAMTQLIQHVLWIVSSCLQRHALFVLPTLTTRFDTTRHVVV